MINRMASQSFAHTLLTGVALGAALGVAFGWGESLPVFAWTFLTWCVGATIIYALVGVTLGRSRTTPPAGRQ